MGFEFFAALAGIIALAIWLVMIIVSTLDVIVERQESSFFASRRKQAAKEIMSVDWRKNGF